MTRQAWHVGLLGLFTLLLSLTTAQAKIYYHDTFETLDGWVVSSHKPDYGKVNLSSGTVVVDEAKQRGLCLTEDNHFYAVTKKLPTAIDNAGKDFVISYAVRHEQNLKCGGEYIKLLPDLDPADFNDKTEYWLMFGPDRCPPTNRVHIILNAKGSNELWSKNVAPPYNKLTSVYTLHIAPNNTYVLYINGTEMSRGNLEDEWKLLPSKTIDDPEDKKPADWVDEAYIDDPEDKKPADWDDEPATIPDPNATKPEDWNDSEDGVWDRPQIPNPKYKGVWRARRIENPAFKGAWTPRKIDNPAYQPEANLYKAPKPIAYIGIDVWQVEAGSIFSDIIIGDDVQEVLKLVEERYGSFKDKEADAMREFLESAAERIEPPQKDATSASYNDNYDMDEDDL